ncbi:hypothetical protein CONPUDRAFT_78641 [Coniophora puteana RWD-64-598 SS2]|uniref:Uncharacterized protein n=1 Tax=Coniophora puteana (strain RWD-64-598) TaxID=741705 RepID=A0A5M3N4L8_CONPW|nr:uncharacterized protein CONPUDRAFT_78641 [Coniophora puteana RWD-64-598 SS2]EIW86197.1 hypothetical protein CONPUDRAFT_78641 [Coniophora puteana RWD-64-598 SS2]
MPAEALAQLTYLWERAKVDTDTMSALSPSFAPLSLPGSPGGDSARFESVLIRGSGASASKFPRIQASLWDTYVSPPKYTAGT